MTEGFNWRGLLFVFVGALGYYGYTTYGFPAKAKPQEKAGLTREYAYKICEQVCMQESMIVVDALRNMKVFADVGTYDTIKSLPSIGCQNECWNRIQP